MDTTLSGLYRSMLVDGAAMLVKFHGINGDFPTNYSADYARRQSAQSSIPGFMQVSTLSIFASIFAAVCICESHRYAIRDVKLSYIVSYNSII